MGLSLLVATFGLAVAVTTVYGTSVCPTSLPDNVLKLDYNDTVCLAVFKDEKKSFGDARQACKSHGALLVSPTYGNLNSWIAGEISRDGLAYGYIWIGLSDIEREGTYKFENGKQWLRHKQRPDKAAKDCFALFPSSTAWIDYMCDTQLPFICEYNTSV